MEERQFKLLLFSPQSAFYLDVITGLRARAHWFFTGEQEDLIVPYAITCAAALECMLNDCLLGAFRRFKHLESQIPGYLSMTLKGKLINVVPIVTAQRFAINQAHKAYQSLVELIRIRNRLVHNTSSYFEEHTATWKEGPEGKRLLTLPEGVDLETPKKHDYTFGITGDVGRFHDALEELHNKFLMDWDPDDFKGNDLIIPQEPAPNVVTFRVKEET